MRQEFRQSQYWRNLAKEARIAASQLDDAIVKGALERIAETYDDIAARVAEREPNGFN